jgi:hypothetical protein
MERFGESHGTWACGLCVKRTFCPLPACMKAEFNSAGLTDLEVYVPYVPKSAGWQSAIAGGEEEGSLTRARVYTGRRILELRSLVLLVVGECGFRR